VIQPSDQRAGWSFRRRSGWAALCCGWHGCCPNCGAGNQGPLGHCEFLLLPLLHRFPPHCSWLRVQRLEPLEVWHCLRTRLRYVEPHPYMPEFDSRRVADTKRPPGDRSVVAAHLPYINALVSSRWSISCSQSDDSRIRFPHESGGTFRPIGNLAMRRRRCARQEDCGVFPPNFRITTDNT
jgi:hypothetical protein